MFPFFFLKFQTLMGIPKGAKAGSLHLEMSHRLHTPAQAWGAGHGCHFGGSCP